MCQNEQIKNNDGGIGDLPLTAEQIAAIKAKAENNRITCGESRALAAELGIDLATFGKALFCLGIKIKQCQLGCF